MAMLFGCASPPPEAEAPPSATEVPPAEPPATAPEPAAATAIPAPSGREVRSAIERIYKDLVTLTADSAYYTGDFNGDGSVDLAATVRPVAGKLDEINSDVAAWLIRDPLLQKAPRPVAGTATAAPHGAPKRPVRVTASDATLLVVIHGYGAQGWRDPEAQQTYLLKSAIGSGPQVLLQRKSMAAIKKGQLPPARGDMIKSTIGGHSGVLYYDGSSYAWYDPRAPRGEIAATKLH